MLCMTAPQDSADASALKCGAACWHKNRDTRELFGFGLCFRGSGSEFDCPAARFTQQLGRVVADSDLWCPV
eukprot:3017566-Rhodomonas_salina.1